MVENLWSRSITNKTERQKNTIDFVYAIWTSDLNLPCHIKHKTIIHAMLLFYSFHIFCVCFASLPQLLVEIICAAKKLFLRGSCGATTDYKLREHREQGNELASRGFPAAASPLNGWSVFGAVRVGTGIRILGVIDGNLVVVLLFPSLCKRRLAYQILHLLHAK